MSSSLEDLYFRLNKVWKGKIDPKKGENRSNKIHSIEHSREILRGREENNPVWVSNMVKLSNLKDNIKEIDFENGYLEEKTQE